MALFLLLTHTERAAHTLSAEWKQDLVSMWACPRRSHTCYKRFATGRTWSSGWSNPGHPVATLRRAGPCRHRTRSYPWQSSSRAAQRSRCPSVAAMDRNALAGNHFQRKQKEKCSCKLFHWVFTGYSAFHSAFQLQALHRAAPTPFGRLGHEVSPSKDMVTCYCTVGLHLFRPFGFLRAQRPGKSRDESSLKQRRGFLSDVSG